MARPQVIFLSASFKFRVCGLIRDGMCRYAAARRWDVRSMSWDEAKAGALRKAFSAARPLGFVVECGDNPGWLPVSIYRGLPAVFVNCAATPPGRRFARIPIDNEAIGRAASQNGWMRWVQGRAYPELALFGTAYSPESIISLW